MKHPARHILTYLLALLVWAGCKPAPAEDPALAAASDFEARLKARRERVAKLGTNGVDFDQVYVAVRRVGVPKAATHIAADETYVMPPREWVTRDLAALLRREFYALGILSPVASAYGGPVGAFDCDDFADGAAFYAQATARTGLKTPAGVVFGVLYYTRDTGGRHALNFSLTHDAGVIFFEPQTLREVSLSATEIASVDFWRF